MRGINMKAAKLLAVLDAILWGTGLWMLSFCAGAQASSPFQTGAENLLTNLTAIATPIAALLIIVLGIAAATGRLSWGWPIGALVGIGIMFGAPTIVTWARSVFGV
jgi:type IV secretion system protein VirB2